MDSVVFLATSRLWPGARCRSALGGNVLRLGLVDALVGRGRVDDAGGEAAPTADSILRQSPEPGNSRAHPEDGRLVLHFLDGGGAFVVDARKVARS